MAGIGWRRESHCGVARDGHPVYKPAVATVVVILRMLAAEVVFLVMVAAEVVILVVVAAMVVKVVMETTVVVTKVMNAFMGSDD